VNYVDITSPVVAAWTVGTQIDMDVSGRILRAWIPAIHAGMTGHAVFHEVGRVSNLPLHFCVLCG
jgi:hypothetical protein